jgi:serine protein kinase
MSEVAHPEKHVTHSDESGGSQIQRIAKLHNSDLYRDLSWEGSFEDYLDIVRKRPETTRSAFQRLYDMVMSYGTEEYVDNKKKLIRYNFFRDERDGGRDAVFGLDIPLMRLMKVLKAAAQGYGPEKRVILLHGPVGSSKSTIARLLRRVLERYSPLPEGALYTVQVGQPAGTGLSERPKATPSTRRCTRAAAPDPDDWREAAIAKLRPVERQVPRAGRGRPRPCEPLHLHGLMTSYHGDWAKVVENHMRVRACC